MCGRYGRIAAPARFADLIGAQAPDDDADEPGYNLTPGRFRLCALRTPKGVLKLGSAWWGFLPSWATDDKVSPINARSETAHEKPMFAKPFAQRRCLVAASHWYEWQRTAPNAKQPWVIRPADAEPFFFAGLWSQAKGLPADHTAAGRVSFAILTGEPEFSISQIHNRQPLALTNDAAREWVAEHEDSQRLQEILADGRVTEYEFWPVSTAVNKPGNEGPELLERL